MVVVVLVVVVVVGGGGVQAARARTAPTQRNHFMIASSIAQVSAANPQRNCRGRLKFL